MTVPFERKFSSGCRLLAVACLCIALCAAFLLGAEPPRAKLRVAQGSETLTVLAGELPVLEYRRIPSPNKPYVSKLFSPAGVQILRDAPSDHKHHHALMFALAADNVNFWEERTGSGTERPRSVKLLGRRNLAGRRGIGFEQLLDWVDPNGDRLLVMEQRTIDVLGGPGLPATLVTWRSRLSAAKGRDSIQLGGAHYFGLGMRFIEAMDRGGRFFNSDGLEGESVRGSEQLTPARWCAYAASVDGRQVTAAIFDHPRNLRHPNKIFTMTTPFAYLAATLNLWKEPLTLKAGSPMELVYGVALWDGSIEAAPIEAFYRQWAK